MCFIRSFAGSRRVAGHSGQLPGFGFGLPRQNRIPAISREAWRRPSGKNDVLAAALPSDQNRLARQSWIARLGAAKEDRMSHVKSREVVLAIKLSEDLLKGLDALRTAWKDDPASVPRGLSCSQSKEGQFVLVAAESAFVTLPGACVIKGIGAIELIGAEPVFEDGASSKTLVLRDTAEGWKFSVKFLPPIVRERNAK